MTTDSETKKSPTDETIGMDFEGTNSFRYT